MLFCASFNFVLPNASPIFSNASSAFASFKSLALRPMAFKDAANSLPSSVPSDFTCLSSSLNTLDISPNSFKSADTPSKRAASLHSCKACLLIAVERARFSNSLDAAATLAVARAVPNAAPATAAICVSTGIAPDTAALSTAIADLTTNNLDAKPEYSLATLATARACLRQTPPSLSAPPAPPSPPPLPPPARLRRSCSFAARRTSSAAALAANCIRFNSSL